MTRRDLDAAGIIDPTLRDSYETCRALNAAHGKTYYLATLLLPPAKRPYIHALYGFARYADDIVDDLGGPTTPTERRRHLESWGDQFLADLKSGDSKDPVCRAVIDTVDRWDIPHEHFEAFLRSMQMDLTVTEYADYDALHDYMFGSAAVIGLQVLPVLEPASPDAARFASDLGIAFQLANFIRDVGEDLDRGRVYLPLADLERFELSRSDLERRVVDERVRALLQFEIKRVRRLEQSARPGIALLSADCQPCIEAARVLYCGIVDAVERIDYQVFTHRATVSLPRRVRVAMPQWLRALRARGARKTSSPVG
jgi:phytoene synthase